MKHLKITFILSLLFLTCCTEIDKGDYLIDYNPPIPEGADIRYIVLEDYTGMRCSNCPKAAAKTATLKEIYKERLIPVSIHAGYFARPINGYDLRSAEAEEYNSYFSITGNPQGIANRTSYKNNRFYPVDMWDGAVEAVPVKSPFGINLTVGYDNKTRLCIINTEITRFQINANNTVDIIVWIVEDNIATPQIIENGSVVENYVQRHVFRKSLNGTWGKAALIPEYTGVAQKQEEIEYYIPLEYKEQDCSLVVILCDHDSKEIFQAKEISVIVPVE